MTTDYDVIVVGGGVIGLSTAYHLGKNSYGTLLLEQFPLHHTRGSSYGHSRLVKNSHLRTFVTELSSEARKTWLELEKSSNIQLTVKNGNLDICHTSLSEKMATLKEGLTKNQSDFKLYQGNDLSGIYPGLKFDHNFYALYEPTGMVLKADKCLAALKNEFLKYGGIIHDEEKVEDIIPVNSSRVLVRTNKQTYSARSLVLACGPWISKLATQLGLSFQAQAVRVSTYYWRETQPGTYSAHNGFPTLVLYFKEFHLYSTPLLEYPGLVKVCYHHRSPIDPDCPDRIKEEDEMSEKYRLGILKELIRNHFPYLEDEPVLEEICLQTITPVSTPLIDRHPRHPNIIIGAAFQGYGFGIAPEVGRILSTLATSLNIRHPYSELTFAMRNKTSKL